MINPIEVVVVVKYVGTDDEGHPHEAEQTFKFAPEDFWLEQSRPVEREYSNRFGGRSRLTPLDHLREVVIRGKPKMDIYERKEGT
jgi:hypothetical protein